MGVLVKFWLFSSLALVFFSVTLAFDEEPPMAIDEEDIHPEELDEFQTRAASGQQANHNLPGPEAHNFPDASSRLSPLNKGYGAGFRSFAKPIGGYSYGGFGGYAGHGLSPYGGIGYGVRPYGGIGYGAGPYRPYGYGSPLIGVGFGGYGYPPLRRPIYGGYGLHSGAYFGGRPYNYGW